MTVKKPTHYRVLSVPEIDFSKFEKVLYENFGKDSRREDAFQSHVDTQSVIIKFTEDFNTMKEGEALGVYDEIFPEIDHIFEAIVKEYGWENMCVLRILIARLPAKKSIPVHTDGGISFHRTHRIHYALKTNPHVKFLVDGVELPFQENPCMEINNLKPHSVYNGGDEDRIHLIMDIHNKD